MKIALVAAFGIAAFAFCLIVGPHAGHAYITGLVLSAGASAFVAGHFCGRMSRDSR